MNEQQESHSPIGHCGRTRTPPNGLPLHAFIWALLIAGVLQQAYAQVLWYGDPEKGYKESFYRLSVESGEPASVEVVTDPSLGKVWSVHKPVGSKRAELARTNGYIPSEGDKVYIGWRFRASIAGDVNPGGFAIFQNKSDGDNSQNYPILMGYNGTSMGLTVYDPGTTSQESRGRGLWSKSVREGQWVALVLGVKFSRDARIGHVELWFDGVKQDLKGQEANRQVMQRTLDDNGNYFKWGAYNEASRNFDITVGLSDMRVAKDLASADPDNHRKGSIAVTAVSLSPSSLTLPKGQTKQLVVVVSPADAANKAVTISSSDNAIATVSATGLVTAISPGAATILVRTKDGGKMDSTRIQVSPSVGIEDRKLALGLTNPEGTPWIVLDHAGRLRTQGDDGPPSLGNLERGLYLVRVGHRVVQVNLP